MIWWRLKVLSTLLLYKKLKILFFLHINGDILLGTMVNLSLLVTKGFEFYLFTLTFLVVHLKITIVRNFVFRIINLNTDAVASSAVEMFLFVWIMYESPQSRALRDSYCATVSSHIVTSHSSTSITSPLRSPFLLLGFLERCYS